MIKHSKYGIEFRRVVKGKNFMTPEVEGFYLQGDYVCELSHGTFNGDMWGVTVVDVVRQVHEGELSKCFDNRQEAITYIDRLA